MRTPSNPSNVQLIVPALTSLYGYGTVRSETVQNTASQSCLPASPYYEGTPSPQSKPRHTPLLTSCQLHTTTINGQPHCHSITLLRSAHTVKQAVYMVVVNNCCAACGCHPTCARLTQLSHPHGARHVSYLNTNTLRHTFWFNHSALLTHVHGAGRWVTPMP